MSFAPWNKAAMRTLFQDGAEWISWFCFSFRVRSSAISAWLRMRKYQREILLCPQEPMPLWVVVVLRVRSPLVCFQVIAVLQDYLMTRRCSSFLLKKRRECSRYVCNSQRKLHIEYLLSHARFREQSNQLKILLGNFSWVRFWVSQRI